MSLLLLAGLFAVMYFMMIRPQQRRRREAERMQSSLSVGNKVVTVGGMHGVVAAMDDDTVSIEIAPGTVVAFARPAIAQAIPAADETADQAAGSEQ
ncbi:preprotein translocase subunit YajC [Pilimelia columellifera]